MAFELLVQMYREEIENTGKPGWPNQPSVPDTERIPAAILENNLYGIDLDLRAVQLSALTLYFKARSFNRTALLRNSNLACADVLLLNGERLEGFLREMHLSHPIYERIIKTLWHRLKDASQTGSLLRLEDEIRKLISKEKERFNREGRQLDIFGWSLEQFEKEASNEEYWKTLEHKIIESFNEFARLQAEQGKDESYFIGEATKGLRLLDVMLRQYDIVVTNPPYLDVRDYNSRLKSFMESAYPNSKRNLYAAFLERCLEFLKPGARLGIITPPKHSCSLLALKKYGNACVAQSPSNRWFIPV
ncbi:hypothetical protein HY02_00365 [Peptococcaceae bacterium SCADC1_2_3]|nr:hypothetical protein DK28_0209855 [Peptococcaceae bacterium SCADC1_2_3]KFI34863.1 hypothetical protein HY00_08985 [Peptococcaceae bacterium SCADC1_2_3]KFI38365.1 hypothetical protein HY02_00365 [Peptococcaceae bacterium SCADC1_2_3]